MNDPQGIRLPPKEVGHPSPSHGLKSSAFSRKSEYTEVFVVRFFYSIFTARTSNFAPHPEVGIWARANSPPGGGDEVHGGRDGGRLFRFKPLPPPEGGPWSRPSVRGLLSPEMGGGG